jgi:spermidine/putrescine-binding protein
MILRRTLFTAGLAACGSAIAGCRLASRHDRVLRIFNWSDYIAPELVERFARLHDCQIVYDSYASDAELETRLATGGGGYDLVFPSDRALVPLLAKQLLQPLNRSLLPAARHLDPQFLGIPADPTNRFSLPYFWGTLAIGTRSDRVQPRPDSFAVLFDRRYRGRITVLDDLEATIGAALLHLGYPLNSVDPQHLTAAAQLLRAQRPLLQAYTSDAYRERLIAGEAWVALGWSGDLLQASREEARIEVIVPREGTMLWVDSMAIPRAARQTDLAHALINFLLDPQVARDNALAVQYATPNRTARGLLPAEVQADPRIYPPSDVLQRCQWLRYRGPQIARLEAVWRQVRA